MVVGFIFQRLESNSPWRGYCLWLENLHWRTCWCRPGRLPLAALRYLLTILSTFFLMLSVKLLHWRYKCCFCRITWQVPASMARMRQPDSSCSCWGTWTCGSWNFTSLLLLPLKGDLLKVTCVCPHWTEMIPKRHLYNMGYVGLSEVYLPLFLLRITFFCDSRFSVNHSWPSLAFSKTIEKPSVSMVTQKPFIQWQWFNDENHWKNHRYQWLKCEKPLKNHRQQWFTSKKPLKNHRLQAEKLLLKP